MPGLYLRNPGSRNGGHCWNEAMHLRIQRYLLDDGGAIGLERAAVVLDGHPGDLADQPVGNSGGDLTGDELVLALESPPDHDVIARLDGLEEHRNIQRVVLQVTVHGHHNLTGGEFDPRRHGRGLATVTAELHHLEP